jgi:hypothetical protein
MKGHVIVGQWVNSREESTFGCEDEHRRGSARKDVVQVSLGNIANDSLRHEWSKECDRSCKEWSNVIVHQPLKVLPFGLAGLSDDAVELGIASRKVNEVSNGRFSSHDKVIVVT